MLKKVKPITFSKWWKDNFDGQWEHGRMEDEIKEVARKAWYASRKDIVSRVKQISSDLK